MGKDPVTQASCLPYPASYLFFQHQSVLQPPLPLLLDLKLVLLNTSVEWLKLRVSTVGLGRVCPVRSKKHDIWSDISSLLE